MRLFDTHAHLDQPEFAEDLASVLERAADAGVRRMLCVGIDAKTSEAAALLADAHQEIYAAVGIQPNCVHEAAADDWQRIAELAARPRVVALGETGLDRYWNHAPLELQKEYFLRHLELGRQRGLPVVIHSRDADADMLAILTAAAQCGSVRGIMHAFSSDTAMVESCCRLGLHVSLAGNASYTNHKFAALRAAASAVPDDRLLLETDSPYLVPHPLRGRLKRNEPAHIVHTLTSVAALRGVPAEQLAERTWANACRLFGLPVEVE